MKVGRIKRRETSTMNHDTRALRTSSRWGLVAVALLIIVAMVGVTMVAGTSGSDDKMTSLGKYQIEVHPAFQPLMAGYPGYDATEFTLTSPTLHDTNNVVGRSV